MQLITRNSRACVSKSIRDSENFKTRVLKGDVKISQTLSYQIQIPAGRVCHTQTQKPIDGFRKNLVFKCNVGKSDLRVGKG